MVRFWRGALAGCSISHPLLRWPLVRMRHRVGNVLQGQGYCESIRASPHNPLECDLRFPSSAMPWPRRPGQVSGFEEAGLTDRVINAITPRIVRQEIATFFWYLLGVNLSAIFVKPFTC